MEMEYFLPRGTNSALNIALLAIMTALTTIATSILVIPYPVTNGYFNLGDTMVMLGGLMLGPIGGFIIGGFGSAFADMILAPIYVPITFVVKGFEGMAVGYFCSKTLKTTRLSKWDITGVLVGSVIMLVGYLLGEILLWGFEFALAELIAVNLAQVTAGAIVALLVGPTIRSYLRTINYRPSGDSSELPSEELPSK
ncbi:ECF transporter S component [Candidatus Thorarchaeota archaeon]|nr:MAG: ECF transporter S component [Candidatus Thorarchaeota archaeon]